MNNVAGKHLESIARGGSASLAGAGVAALSNFLLVVVITNGFSREVAGGLFSATSIFLMVLAVASLGMDAGLGRFILKHVVENRWEGVRETLRNTGVVSASISFAAGLVLFVLADRVAALAGLPADSGPPMLRVLAAGMPLAAVGNWALSASRAFSSIRQTVVLDKLFRSLLQLLLVSVAARIAVAPGVLAAAWVVPAVLMAPLAVLSLRRLYRARAPRGDAAVSAPGAVREFWRFTGPRSIAQIAQMIVQRADIVIIGALISPVAAAVYTAATRFVPLGQLGATAVQQVVQPRFTHLLATREHAALGAVFRTTTAWNVTLAWPVYLAVGSVPGLYLQMFGAGFADDGATVVVVMMLGMLVGVASGPVDTLLLMSGRTWVSLSNALVALVIDLAGCFLLIPRIGIAGAAIAWCVAIVAKSLLGMYQVHRYEGISPLSWPATLVGIAAVLCFGVPGAALTGSGLATLPNYLVALLAGGFCYIAFLAWQRERLHLVALRSMLPARLRRDS